MDLLLSFLMKTWLYILRVIIVGNAALMLFSFSIFVYFSFLACNHSHARLCPATEPCHLPPGLSLSEAESVSLLFTEPSLCNHCIMDPSSYPRVDGPRHTGILDPDLLSAHFPTPCPLGYFTQYWLKLAESPPPGQLSVTITSSTSHSNFFRLCPSTAIIEQCIWVFVFWLRALAAPEQ